MGVGIYSAAMGMGGVEKDFDLIAHNIANASTTAFKEVVPAFADVMSSRIRAAGADTGGGDNNPMPIEIGNGSKLVATRKNFKQGDIQQTDRPMDLAINGDGFFEVTTPEGTRYTRAGDLSINSEGQVTTSTGFPVESGFSTITNPSNANISIADNGQVTVTQYDGSTETFRIELTTFANPEGLESIGNNLYKDTGDTGSGTPSTGNPGEDGIGSVIQAHLERSNVSVIMSMVRLIKLQHQNESCAKVIDAASEMERAINNLRT